MAIFWEKLCGLSFAAGGFQRFSLTDSGVLPPWTKDTSLGRREEQTGVSVHWCSSPEMKKVLTLQLTACQYRSMSSGGRNADWVADGAVGFSVRDLKRWRTQHCLSITWVCGDQKFTNARQKFLDRNLTILSHRFAWLFQPDLTAIRTYFTRWLIHMNLYEWPTPNPAPKPTHHWGLDKSYEWGRMN